jgi:NADH-quinone oxidoreductase subunit N
MSTQDLLMLSPLIIVALAGTAVMLAGAFGARRETLHWMAVAGIGLGLASVIGVRPDAPRDVTTLLRVDSYAILFLTLLFSAAGVVAIVSRPYLRARRCSGEAYYSLLLFASVGMGVLACSTHFASFFLGLETLTVSLYVLMGYLRDDRPSLEAAIKYLVLAAMASGFLLFGIALLYAATGSLLLATVVSTTANLLASAASPEAVWAAAGVLMLLAGFAFKLALVPFHMWSPDVYQGAPAPVTALIATGSKGALIAVLLRMLAGAPAGETGLAALLAALAVATMFGGNLLALLQTDVKRLLAYSSVAHIGYIFVALAAGGTTGSEAVVFYTITYVVTTLGAFGVVAVLSAEGPADADDLAGYRGLGRRRPALAAVFAIMLLSLAGVPPTGGFLAKFAVLSAAIAAGRTGLALAMVAASGVAIFYYLRILVVMYMEPAAEAKRETGGVLTVDNTPAVAAGSSVGSLVALTALVAIVLAIGLYPEPWLRAVGAAVASVIRG